MLDAPVSPYQPDSRENSGESQAERIARIAQSPAAQSLAGQAPSLTRRQLDAVRAACSPATARFREREAGRTPVDHQALERRREAALRLPPLDNGRRDPMDLIGRSA